MTRCVRCCVGALLALGAPAAAQVLQVPGYRIRRIPVGHEIPGYRAGLSRCMG
jgi:hypothetical protein